MNFEKPALTYNRPETGEQLDDDIEDVDYSPEDLQHLDQATDAAAEIIRWSLTSEASNNKTIETSEGIRGYVSNTFAGGSVDGLFDGSKLDQVGINLENGEESKHLSIQGLEDGEESRVFIDGELVNAVEIPAVQRVVDAIRQEMSAVEQVAEKMADEEPDSEYKETIDEESDTEIKESIDEDLGVFGEPKDDEASVEPKEGSFFETVDDKDLLKTEATEDDEQKALNRLI